MIQIDIQLFLRHPIRKLLVPINQSSYLVCFCYNFFDRTKETNMYERKSRRLRSQILNCLIFLVFIFKKIAVSLKKSNLSEKNVIVEEELDRIDINDIVNLENSPKLVLIDEECANFRAVNDW